MTLRAHTTIESVDAEAGGVGRGILRVMDELELVDAGLLGSIRVKQQVPCGAVVRGRALVARRHDELVPQATELRVVLSSGIAHLVDARAGAHAEGTDARKHEGREKARCHWHL